ncbi:MAG: serine/threonine protein kinase, partial [Methylococcales bacterium]|nr:serine/threonine protein kinase [Methylococcales bacterium]
KFKSRFCDEAKALAKFKHHALVRVLNYFEANDTGYLVMEYEQGQSLKQYLQQHGKLGEAKTCQLILPLLDGLETMHQAELIHRDIKPSNIYIRDNGNPVLLDFGSARPFLKEHSGSLTALYTPGYAPLEQYNTDSTGQGPWSDIYAMAAVMYKMITGDRPAEAHQRAQAILSGKNDIMPSAQSFSCDKYSRHFLQAIDHGLGVVPALRPQLVQPWKQAIIQSELAEVTNLRKNIALLQQENKQLQRENTTTFTQATKPRPIASDYDLAVSHALTAIAPPTYSNKKAYSAIIGITLTAIGIWAAALEYHHQTIVFKPSLIEAKQQWQDPSTGMTFMWVQKGCYQSTHNPDKSTAPTCIDGYWISKQPINKSQWQRLMDKTLVSELNISQAEAFIEKLNRLSGKRFRLPSKQEQEWAVTQQLLTTPNQFNIVL